jgi:hypothetical protein
VELLAHPLQLGADQPQEGLAEDLLVEVVGVDLVDDGTAVVEAQGYSQ